MSDLNFYGGSPFRIKRPLITTNGIVSAVDDTIKAQLDELDSLLAKRVVAAPGAVPAANGARPPNGQNAAAAANGAAAPFIDVTTLLSKALTAKYWPATIDGLLWDQDSIAFAFSSTDEPADAAELAASTTLSDLIDATSPLSSLKYALQNNLSANWDNLDYNTQTVLDGYSGITDYLIAFGYFVMGLTEVNGLTNFLLSNRLGAKNVVNYAVVSAARSIIDREQLVVPDYNSDDGDIVIRIRAAGLTLSSASFSTALQTLVDDYIFNKRESDLVDNSQLGLPPELKPQLIKYIKASPVPINTANATFFLPVFVSQILAGSSTTAGAGNGQTDDSADQDFGVQYLTDDQTLIQVSRSAVRCAAQLFYSMVLGDELDVFGTVNYFTHKYLIRGGIEIVDKQLRDDLQLYVFSNKFIDLRSGATQDRSRPAERHMFYRQVFNWGHGPVTRDLIVNREYHPLWKVLMLECAKYLERAQISPNPDSYVSRQNVMQAVEDLQYNLSTHCTGMANVITPLIYAELNFVVRRIFMHDEVLRQIVPQGGTWWRVVETLYMAMKNARPRSTVLYNKAKLGDSILRQIADYNTSTFEKDGPFGAFISNAEAFITTQSILQESVAETVRQGDDDDHDEADHHRPNGDGADMPRAVRDRPDMPPPAAAASGQAPGGDEWAF
jgi:hypothetical protein